MIKKLIQKIFNVFGYKINKLNAPTIIYKNNASFTMQAALKSCVARGLTVNTIIDVGASVGRWSKPA